MNWHYGIRKDPNSIMKKKRKRRKQDDEEVIDLEGGEDIGQILDMFSGGMENKFSLAGDRVKRDGNDIYFYTSVKTASCLDLISALKSAERENLTLQLENNLDEPPKIYLHINSLGGSVFDAFSVIDYILKCKVPVVSIIEGCAASAATMISMVANERVITKHSYMLIHQLSSMAWGKFSEIEDEFKNLQKLMRMIKGLYKEYTKVQMKKLDEILKHDIWWRAEDCLKFGLVDKID